MNTKNIAIVLVVLALIGIGYFFITNNDNKIIIEKHHKDEIIESYEIYPGDVVDKIKNKENIILLDVRTLEEYEKIHLENALLLPVQELFTQSLMNIGLGDNAKDKEIIIYCRSGARSKTAYDIMNSLGYTNIKSIAGGMVHWEED
ncbi:MAG: rhodanese-like domain-containing protein, partial [Nitrosopumilus sp.]